MNVSLSSIDTCSYASIPCQVGILIRSISRQYVICSFGLLAKIREPLQKLDCSVAES